MMFMGPNVSIVLFMVFVLCYRKACEVCLHMVHVERTYHTKHTKPHTKVRSNIAITSFDVDISID